MDNGVLIGMLVIALGVHLALVRANRWLGTGAEHAPAGRISALLTHIATVAAIAGWGTLALDLVLDAMHVHAVSTVLAGTVVLMIPPALICLVISLALRFVARSGGLRPAARRAYRHTWRFIRAVIPLLGAALLALVSLTLLTAKKIAEGSDHSILDPGSSENVGAQRSGFNYRTLTYDDRTDPSGIYRDD